jgi:CBS domain-containing protein
MAALVKDHMIQKQEIVSPEDSVQSAVELMIDRDMGSVIVEDENEKVIGIFTERDLLRHYLLNQSKFFHLKVSEVMSAPVITVTPDVRIAQALKIMNEHNIRRLPVVDATGRLIGFLSWKELLLEFKQEIQ